MQDASSTTKRLFELYSRKSDPSPVEGYSRIVQALWKRYGIGRDVRTLEYIAHGKQEAGSRLAQALEKLLDWRTRPKKKTVTVRYEPDDPRRDRALRLTMEQRRQALEEKAKELRL